MLEKNHFQTFLFQKVKNTRRPTENVLKDRRRTLNEKRDGWMSCDYTSLFLTVFQSYQDDVLLIMKPVCNGTPFMVEKISPRAGIELGPLDQ